MQQLNCSVCGKDWEREPKRGRPPKVCPDCKDGNSTTPPEPVEVPKPTPKAKAPEKAGENKCPTRGCRNEPRESQLLDGWLFCSECKTMSQ